MEQLVTSSFRLGVIAGGQLGKMLALTASPWDVKTYILDSDPHCPASTVCTRCIAGNPTEFEPVYQFGQTVDMLTFEIENVNLPALMKLKDEGKRINPDPVALATIQDKGKQKQFFLAHGIPSPAFTLTDSREEILRSVDDGRLGFPFVQKTRTAGYDGRGVAVVRGEKDLPKLLEGPSVIEDAVDIEKELAVIVARNGSGQLAPFPVVELVPNPEANLVEMLVSPARIEPDIHQKATELALHVADALDMRGILAVELFLDKNGQLWVNEVSARPHNSGHHTIESAVTSQYEQHLRAIFGFPLGSTELKRPAVMINLLGEPGHAGPVKYLGLTESLSIPGVKIHIYGKQHTRPFRKMGHVTVVASTLEEAQRRAAQVRQMVRVQAC